MILTQRRKIAEKSKEGGELFKILHSQTLENSLLSAFLLSSPLRLSPGKIPVANPVIPPIVTAISEMNGRRALPGSTG